MAELSGAPVDLDRLTALALTNYGHFTTMRVEGDGVRGLSLHLERLVRDCRALFAAELDPDRVRHFVRRLLPGNGPPVIVRVTVFDPDLDLGHPGADAVPQVLVTTRPASTSPACAPLLQSTVGRCGKDSQSSPGCRTSTPPSPSSRYNTLSLDQ